MLRVSTFVQVSPIHGLGCFAGEYIGKGTVVWDFLPPADEEIRPSGSVLTFWERSHSYKSHVKAGECWILPRDNAAWMNFSKIPNLIEGDLMNGEPCLVARIGIFRGEELTVGVETDADAYRKLGPARKAELEEKAE